MAKFEVFTIIHVILLNIPDNYDKIRSIRRRSIGSHKFKIQKMHVLCQHILLDFIFREIYKIVHHWRNIVRNVMYIVVWTQKEWNAFWSGLCRYIVYNWWLSMRWIQGLINPWNMIFTEVRIDQPMEHDIHRGIRGEYHVPWVDQSLYSPKLKVINCFIIWH